MEWCFRAYANFADFSGRARRTEFAMFFVTTFFLFFLLMAAQEKLGKFGEILTWLFLLASSVPALSVLIRRLHDMGYGSRTVIPVLFIGLVTCGVGFIGLFLAPGRLDEDDD